MCYIQFGSKPKRKEKIFIDLWASMERSEIVVEPTRREPNNAQLFNVSMHKYITYNLAFFGCHALFADFNNNNNNLWAAKQRVMHIAAMNRLRQPRLPVNLSFSVALHV